MVVRPELGWHDWRAESVAVDYATRLKRTVLFPTVYFIEKYNLVLDRDTFRLEVD